MPGGDLTWQCRPVSTPTSDPGPTGPPSPVRTTDEGLRFVQAPTGRPVGLPLPGWTPREQPAPRVLTGRYCRLEAWDPNRHAVPLHTRLHAGDAHETAVRWTYLFGGPYADPAGLRDWLDGLARTPGTWPMVVLTGNGSPEGTASYMRTDPANGAVEVGSIVWSPALQRSRAATEAMYLMARHAVTDLGYRRYEWKCDALNVPSRAAAARLGFTFEGVFRNAVVYKGRNRDTAWFAMTDTDVAALSPAYEAWLEPANFDADGRQLTSLSDLTARAHRRH